MVFSDRSPSKQWEPLKYKGETLAEVWFKPKGEPFVLTFRIPQTSFQIPGVGRQLTTEILLKAVCLAAEDVESWFHGDVTNPGTDEFDPDLTGPLPQPPHGVTHLEIHVRLKAPPPAADAEASGELQIALTEWHDLEARWKAVLGVETTVDTLRKSMESLRAELEASMRRTLTGDEKVNALAADVAQWNKAKSRAHYALPKASEFIHRATWAAGAPERKKLGELFKDPIGTHAALPQREEVLQELEFLRKDRQVLYAQGGTVYQECKSILADVQSALRRLQSNATARASTKKGGIGAKGKSF